MSKELAAELNNLAAKLSDLADVDAGLVKVKTELKSAQDTLVSVRKELADANTGLTTAQKKNAIALDESIFEKNRELNDVKRRAIDAKQELDSILIDLKASQERHTQVEASLNSLRQKFA